MTTYRVSADIGGTFTDIVVEPSDAPVFLGKVPTTPDNPARGVIDGVKGLIGDLKDIEFFVHGTTVGLNAFLERKGERVCMICTRGHGDSYTIARGNRHSLYELRYAKPAQLVARRDVHEISARVTADGEVLNPVVKDDLLPIIDKVKAEGISAVAVCLLHAYAYPEHELAVRAILQAELPGVSVTLSHEIAREWREYERASTAVMNAYVAPVVERYLKTLQDELSAEGLDSTVHIMKSSGGVNSAEAGMKHPVFSLLSGPVGGTIAGTAMAGRVNRPNLLCVDMGGTSFDLSLVVDGQANTTLETELEGLPLLMSIVDIETIGTGGGSIAWLDNGAMRVGPHSAGSQPGPACYGRGGTQATVTDANLYLGRLGNRSLLAGEMSLDTDACATAIELLAAEAGLDPMVFAEGILAISNAAMADAMRTITISQGVDPRDFTLVAFGGAGPMAAVFLASELDVEEVLIPRYPGTFSAWGMLRTDLRKDYTQNFFSSAASCDPASLEEIFQALALEGMEALRDEGVAHSKVRFERSVDMRYTGQEYTINVPIAENSAVADIVASFHQLHQRRFGHSTEASPVEFVNLRLTALGELAKHPDLNVIPHTQDETLVLAKREAIFNGEKHQTPVIPRSDLALDSDFAGPLIIEEQSATTIVPPGWFVSLDEAGNILVSRRNKS
ncbi:MAG: hydantoinase/oxoprolinase family protein [Pseudomonadota bacterium]